VINNFIFRKVRLDKFKILFLTFLFSVSFSNNFDKCIWVKADAMIKEESIYDALIFAYEHEFNKVFLQVRSRGDSFYSSSIVPKNDLIDNNFDPLKYALDLGHSLGLEVHAWVNTYILWSSPNKPSYPNHLYYTNPDWMEVNVHGKSDSSIDINTPQSLNWEGIFLSPNNPEVNNYLRSVFYELIDDYDIDGLHFDYIRFQDDIYGYNKVGRNIFEKKYGFDPFDIERSIISPKYGWSIAEIDSMNSIWSDYKTSNINSLVYKVRNRIDSLNKDIKISAAVKTNPLISKKKWSQDWRYWIDEGIMDFVVTMNYDPSLVNFSKNIESIRSEFSRYDFNKIIMGIAIYNQDALEVSDKIYLSYIYNFKGISLFPYDSKKANTYWFNDILDVFQIID
tara:strand:- start:7493 stop:8674 length:1182 start_codon:yes stop_codon:yes gene_type:complete